MSAVRYRFRAELRTKWRAWFGLALLVGAAGGAVSASAAGVSRTESAYQRFLEEQDAADLLLSVNCSSSPDELDLSCIDEVRSDPAVAASALVRRYDGLVYTADGRMIEVDPTDNCYSGPGDLNIYGDVDNEWGRSINRHRIVAGRATDPTRADEVVISETIADRLDLRPGDSLRATFPNTDPVCTDDAVLEEFPAQEFELTIVGIQRSPTEIRPSSGFYLSSVHLSPAFTRAASAERFAFDVALPVRLQDGTTPEEFLEPLAERGWQVDAFPVSELSGPVEDGHRPYAAALAASTLVGLLAVATVLTPAIARRMRLDAVEQPALWALGATRRDLRRLAVVRAALIAVTAAAVGTIAAVALSPLFPIGPPRKVEPSPGIAIAGRTLGLGALAVASVVVLAALPVCLRVRTRWISTANTRRPRFVGRGASLPVTAWCGVRLAFGRASAAAGGVAAVAIAIAALVGALTFSAGAQHLISTPRLIGINWDNGLLLPETDDEDARRETAREVGELVAQHPAIEGYATGTIWSTIAGSGALQLGPDRIEAAVFGFESHGVEPSIISGRTPVAADEVLLGPKTISQLGLSVGDEVEAYGFEGQWEEEPVPTSARYRIVGTAALPAVDPKGVGFGALFDLDGIRRLNTYSVPDALWLQLAPGTDVASLSFVLADGTDVTEAGFFDLRESVVGADQLAIGSVDAAPIVVAALLGVLGLAVLIHLLAGATFRSRGPLAVLRALGYTRRQTRGAVRWQAVAFMVVPIVAGVPLGVALGRMTFHEYARRLGVVPEPVTWWTATAIVIPAAIVIAIAASAVPAIRAARLRPAAVLRAE